MAMQLSLPWRCRTTELLASRASLSATRHDAAAERSFVDCTADVQRGGSSASVPAAQRRQHTSRAGAASATTVAVHKRLRLVAEVDDTAALERRRMLTRHPLGEPHDLGDAGVRDPVVRVSTVAANTDVPAVDETRT
jgi:hypothetical protein